MWRFVIIVVCLLVSEPNCERLVELGCIESLLSVLQCTDVDASTRLNVTLCLGMLTEDNGTNT